MEQVAILKRDVSSKRFALVITKGSTVIYNPEYKAVLGMLKNNKSEVWVSVKESWVEVVEWVSVKGEEIVKTVTSVPATEPILQWK
jgi:hypothetical protein